MSTPTRNSTQRCKSGNILSTVVEFSFKDLAIDCSQTHQFSSVREKTVICKEKLENEWIQEIRGIALVLPILGMSLYRALNFGGPGFVSVK